MNAAIDRDFDAHVERVYLQLLPLFASEDFKEGVDAFVHRRDPDFKGS